MQEFYFRDKKTNVAFYGLVPKNETNCPPFEYFRIIQAYHSAKLFQDRLNVTCPSPIPEELVMQFVLKKTDDMIERLFANSKPHPNIHQLLTDESLSRKDQERLLRGIILTPTDILWLNKEAQDAGYLLDIYHNEKYPEKFNEKTRPILFHQNKDGTIDKIGTTDMSEGEMHALLEQRKVIQARIYHKDSIWHCFYFTFKGLVGDESGLMGSKPHYHYLSDKSGTPWDELVRRIKECDMPTSKVHIVIDR